MSKKYALKTNGNWSNFRDTLKVIDTYLDMIKKKIKAILFVFRAY